MNKLILISITYILLTVSCSNTGRSQFNNVRNFNFENSSYNSLIWKQHSQGGRIIHDSTECISGKYSFRFEKQFLSNSFDIIITQYFNLPIKSDWIEASVFSKSEFIQSAWLKLWFLDIDENILSKDSVLISNCNTWKKFSIKKKVPNTQKVYIKIQAISNDSILTSKLEQKFWVDNFQLKLNERTFYDYVDSLDIPDSNNKINNSIQINPLNFKELRNIDDFKNHKVLAFGETVHGSLTIQNTVYETIKCLIENGEVKLILFELPFEIGLRINDYISGQKNEDIQKILSGFIYDNSGTYDLLNWLKDYNEKEERKIIFAGIDSNLGNLYGYHHLWSYIKNQRIDTDSLKNLFTLLKQRDIDQAIGYIQNNPYFDTLENVIKNNLTRAFEIRRFEEMSNMPGYEMRDYLQFQNSKFAIETWCNDSDKVLIYAHLSHVNKKCILDASPETPSLGNYMKQNYGNNYFVTALLAGIGEFISMDSTGNYVIAHLQKPFKGSLEMQFLNLPHQICYKNLSDIKSADYGRYVGAYYIHNQFYPYSHKNRFDALFFIHHNKGFGISDFMAKTAFERFEYIRKLRKLDSF